MARISTYVIDGSIVDGDKVIGSDANNDMQTKNYTIGDLVNYFAASIGGNLLVPYVGANSNVDLGAFNLSATEISVSGNFISNGSAGLPGQVLISQGPGSPAIWGYSPGTQDLSSVLNNGNTGSKNINLITINGYAKIDVEKIFGEPAMYLYSDTLGTYSNWGIDDLHLESPTHTVDYLTNKIRYQYGGNYVDIIPNNYNNQAFYLPVYGGYIPISVNGNFADASGNIVVSGGGGGGGSILHGIASGTDTYTVTIAGAPASYSEGDSYIVRFINGNTTGATLNINSLGAVPLYRNNDGPLLGGDIANDGDMLCVYDTSIPAFRVIGTSPNSLLAYVTNADSVAITKGQAVYAFSGQGDRMTVKRANNVGDATSAQTVGLVLSNSIGVNQKGFIMMQGLLDGLNILPTATWSDGDPVYLGSTAGTITNIKPYAPNHLVYLGFVTTASNGSAGRLYVRVQNGFELDELHNVQAQTPTYKDTLWYDNTVSPAQWKTASISTILGYTPFQLPSLTAGSVLFSNGTTIAQDNANFFWDDANNRLGIGTSTPSFPLDINGTGRFTGLLGAQGDFYAGAAGSSQFDINTLSATLPNTLGFWRKFGNGNYTYLKEDEQGGAQHKWAFVRRDGFDQTRPFFQANSSILNINLGWEDANSNNYDGNTLLINPKINITNAGITGTKIRGTYYNPTITSLTNTTHIAYENTSGDIIFGNLAGVGSRMVTADASGKLGVQAIPTSYTFSTGLTNTANTITNNLSTGVAGGQSVVGGTAASNSLTLSSTSNATKGKILFGTSAYDEANNRLGIGTSTPSSFIDGVSTATSGSAYSLVHTQTALNAGDVGDACLKLDYNISGSGAGTELVTRTLNLYSRNNWSTGTVSNMRVFNLQTQTGASSNTTQLDQVYLENVTGGTVTNFRAIHIASSQGTSQGGLVMAQLTGTNRAGVSIGSSALPSGVWSIYSSTSDKSYHNGNFLIGTTTDAGYKLDVNGTTRINSILYTTNKVSLNSQNGYVYRTTDAGAGLSSFTAGIYQVGTSTASGNQAAYFDFSNTPLTFSVGNSNSRLISRTGIGLANLNNTAGSESGDMTFLTQSGGTAMSEKMRIFGNGNVAIGTSSDAGYKLDVNGTGRFQNTLTTTAISASGNVAVTGNIATGSILILGNSAAGGVSYRTTNAGSGITPLLISNNNTSSSGVVGIAIDGTNQLSFIAGNGTNRISRAAIGIASLTNTAGAESGDLTFLTQSGGTAMSEKMRITGAGGLTINATNTAAGTTGNQTINKASGTVNIAAAGTTVTVTNSLVTTSSIVFAVIRTNDATAVIKNVVPGAGSFTINLNAATTAETSIGFFVIN